MLGMTSGPYYFVPKTRSNMAVSPKFWALTILPSRNVNTSASGADSPPAVTCERTTTTSSSARKRLGTIAKDRSATFANNFRDPGFAAIRSADRAVTAHDKLDVVVVVAQDRFDVARAERGVPLLGYLDILTCSHRSLLCVGFLSLAPVFRRRD